jgi:5-bromo-4-chloroindolyl phosphate hydrolysis protein
MSKRIFTMTVKDEEKLAKSTMFAFSRHPRALKKAANEFKALKKRGVSKAEAAKIVIENHPSIERDLKKAMKSNIVFNWD